MKFAISYSTPYYGADPDRIVTFARHAEDCGFEAIYVPEHIAVYPGAKVGNHEIPAELPYPDPLDCLTFIAAATQRILLGTGVLLLPYRHPVILAKRLATIDLLSRGRMRLLTVGLGTLPGEAEAMGVDYGTRGRRADEAIDAMRLLWSGGADGVSYHGEFFAFDNLVSFPKPYGVLDLPIHVGGSSRAAARRAGLRGDGYFPGGVMGPDERAEQMDIARAAAIEAGRDPSALQCTRWGSIDMPLEHVEGLAAQGVTRVVVGADPDRALDQMSRFAERFGLRAGIGNSNNHG
ncbi:TIGR03619 family F420-dependent LLM class oxidoreductase [Nocardia sp. NBC_01730]|uniref:TIGR03619 family F420-dependent LLM class oxidoreductase n=1 Tax=Nocardia sp. NBC_01730 TaxID=2975998 RepID=UPI002E0DC190|nr:TIGR03619 family F420-dependent LLM class oxidoreductase [Nocardia sp. NBC_01730]